MFGALSDGLREHDGIAAGVVIVAALALSIVLLRRSRPSMAPYLNRNGRLLALALNNMTQGIVMFDAAGRLVVCNERYLSMYGLPADVVKPGAALVDIVSRRFASGTLHRDPVQYCTELMQIMAAGKVVSFVSELADGRAISVVNRAIPGCGYWIGTHDDITERRTAERRNALLSEQEGRRAAVESAIGSFRESVEGVLQTVADSVAAMKSTAAALSATSNETSTHTAGAVRTSADAFGQVDVAASAADELEKSIAEINGQLGRATQVVRAAAGEAQSTNADISGLAKVARKIDDVIKLIQSVAGQTNLLALNATIEAARAGTAGKGFAVVASEVKTLAVQTAKATEVIAAQTAAVQASTQSAAQAMGSINGRMQEIQKFTAGIMAAVAQQHAATTEISYNVAAAASGTKSVVAVLQRVSTAMLEMHNSADTVLSASAAVETAAQNLRGSIDSFLRKVAV